MKYLYLYSHGILGKKKKSSFLSTDDLAVAYQFRLTSHSTPNLYHYSPYVKLCRISLVASPYQTYSPWSLFVKLILPLVLSGDAYLFKF